MDVCIVGKGKLAKALLAGLEGRPFDGSSARALIHAGSGREMPEAIAYCTENKVPFIQAATGIAAPENPPFPYIDASNLALDVLRFEQAATLFKGAAATLTESHQAEKKSVPGTAQRIAKALGLREITSIRDPKVQKERFGLNGEELKSHAIHELQLERGGVQMRLEVRITGLEPYVAGAKELLEMDLESLAGGLYSLSELAAIEKSADNIAPTH